MRLLNKTQMNFAYGMGAAVVIIGALMKITHFQFGFLTGNLMLTIGLVTEAIIFALSAFDPPGEDYDWELAFPELKGGKSKPGEKMPDVDVEGMLSKKVDEMLQKAKLDQEVVSSLTKSIKDFETSAKSGADNATELVKINKEFADNASKLTEQMESLASNLEALNNVYGGVLNAMNKK
ncbi:MAG: gliding motility protein GldL [Flavobacteriaceae bacterium]|nr:gliding motility protein GldL [Flavobacteriaceae bacterium]|tara:strand:- start:6183 stop:6719 length:537 start_codon:yes stop_codon:yes gene_type:complete